MLLKSAPWRGRDWPLRTRAALTVVLVGAALLLASNNLLIISVEGRRVTAALALLLLGLLNRQSFAKASAGMRLLGGVLLGATAVLFFLTSYAPYLLFLCVAGLLALTLLLPDAFLAQCCKASLVYFIGWLAYLTNPLLFRALDRASTAATESAGSLFMATAHILGPSAGGFQVLIPFILLFLFGFRLHVRNTLIFAGGLLAAWFLYQLTGMVALTGFAQISIQALLLPLMVPVFLCLALAGPAANTVSRLAPRLRLLIHGGLCLLLASLVASGFLFDAGGKQNRTVLFLDNGFFDLKISNFEKFGALESGLFGLLPKHLALYGYTSTASKEDITPDLLKGVGVFVITNPQRDWKESELAAIWEFVGHGGSLLVLGDHTNIMGTQPVLNRLLAPVRMAFNFDSGFPGRTEWRYCLEPRPHPVTAHLESFHDASISVGATLDIKPPSFPVVMGKYGFADYGDHFNERGAYLGDYRYVPGEKLGDVVLVAANYYGAGKVLVFGDTSPFQNGALAASFPHFVYQVFEWLSNDRGRTPAPLWGLAGYALFFAAFFRLRLDMGTRDVALLLLAGAATMTVCLETTRHRYAFQHKDANVAWVDISHKERLAFYPFQRNSAGALFQNLVRNGFLPYVFKPFFRDDLVKGQAYVSVAPSKPFCADEVEALLAFMDKGGTVLLATGHKDRAGSLPLLSRFGLDIAGTPLGPVPIVKEGEGKAETLVQFVDAWPIVDVSTGKERNLLRVRVREDQVMVKDGRRQIRPDAEREYAPIRDDLQVLYQHKGYVLAALFTRGRGSLVVISDSLFLGEENIEGLNSFKEGNIRFIKTLFDRARGEKSDG